MLAALRSCRLHLPAFGFAVGCGSCKDALCDITVQRASAAPSWSGESAAIDWRRTQIFALFGACFVGGWQYILFTVGMQRLLPQPAAFARKTLTEKLRDREGLKVVAGLVAIENLVNQPFLHFPVYYAIKHSVEHTHDTLRDCVRAGAQRAADNFVPDNVASCAVWVPATIANGLFAPPWARVPLMSGMGAVWTCFMSWRRGAPALDADTAGRGLADRALMA